MECLGNDINRKSGFIFWHNHFDISGGRARDIYHMAGMYRLYTYEYGYMLYMLFYCTKCPDIDGSGYYADAVVILCGSETGEK